MQRRSAVRGGGPAGLLAVGVLSLVATTAVSFAASKTVDLDGRPDNGAESRCDLNVLSTFPVKVENVVTNKAVGNAYDFSWPSAGPGGFTSSATAGTAGGVGAKWTWTTNQSVFSYTGNSCPNDICFLKTAGPDPIESTCERGCTEDGVTLMIGKGASAGEVVLNWTGGDPTYSVYRSPTAAAVTAPSSLLVQTSALSLADLPPAGGIVFYRIRAATCLQLKACRSNADCFPASEGSCVSVGPFAVPGRSLTATDVTVSSASLTSSLITFFSPPTEVFRVTSTAQPGGYQETLTNGSTTPITVVTEAYPPGCCPENPDVPNQLNCDGTCVDYRNDPLNCGACGTVCADGTCCSNGNCTSLCADGQVWCNGVCIDPQNDSANCGACGNACGDGTCCFEGGCASLCSGGDLWCGESCADVQNDSNNCGACGNVCGEGTCCNNGACESTCEAGRTFCSGLCYDLQNDPSNCGTCGNVCAEDSVCTGGACVPCTGQGGRKDVCDNRCVNTNTDPYNCGGCGISCNLDCPSGFTGVCSNGQSCRCVQGTPAPPPPPNTPQPTVPMCPNPNPSPGPVPGVCPNPNPSGPVPGVCPSPGPPAPDVDEAPVCTVDPGAESIPPGGSTTICRPGGVLFKEVASAVSVCGDTIPGPDGTCADGISNVSTGSFMRFIPDTETVIGDAFVTPFAVQVSSDDTMDGLIQPGETVSLIIKVVNAGPMPIVGASATLLASPVDLTDDGISNPVTMSIVDAISSYGTIPGTEPSQNCEPVTLQPVGNQTAFRVTVPADHPGDTSSPFTLHFTGTVNGSPFSADMPIALGIADRCVYALATGDYDGLDGLQNPMERLVPDGDPVVYPSKTFNAGQTRPLKVRLLCGGAELFGGQVEAPQIVGLSEATRGPLDIRALSLNADSPNPDDPFFRWSDTSVRWIYNMRTSEIGTGVFTLKIRIAGRKDYVAGFELE